MKVLLCRVRVPSDNSGHPGARFRWHWSGLQRAVCQRLRIFSIFAMLVYGADHSGNWIRVGFGIAFFVVFQIVDDGAYRPRRFRRDNGARSSGAGPDLQHGGKV